MTVDRAGPLPCPTPSRFLLVRLSSLGDVLNALPAAHALRTSFPNAHLAWVVDPQFAPLLRRSDLLNEVLELPLPNGQQVCLDDVRRLPQLWCELHQFRQRLRNSAFDIVLELQGLLRSAVTAHFTRAPVRLGFVDERRELNYLFLNRRVPPRGRHAVDRYRSLAFAAGATACPPQWGALTSDVDEEAADQLLAEIPEDQPLVALNPGASRAYKCWPPARFAAVADAVIKETEAAFVVLGSPAERSLAQAVCEASRAPLLNLAGRTSLTQLAAVLRRCRCVVTGDTGPMHLAVAVGSTVVALCGVTDATVTGPYGSRHVVFQVPRPSQDDRRPLHDPTLMLKILPQPVADAVCQVVSRSLTLAGRHGSAPSSRRASDAASRRFAAGLPRRDS